MAGDARWQEDNDRYLAAALAWIRLRLAGRIEQDSESEGATIDNDARFAAAEMDAAAAVAEPPALINLARIFDLSRFEQETLLLCAALELDTSVHRLCALAQGDASWTYPTFALALTLFDDPAWDILSPKRPLRYWRLIEISRPAGQPLVNSALKVDERIVNYLKGLNDLDDSLSPFLISSQETRTEQVLSPSQRNLAGQILYSLRRPQSLQNPPVIQLLGADAISKRLVAQHVAAALDLTLCRLPVGLLPSHTAELETLARLWQREAMLLPLALYLDAAEVDEDGLAGGPSSPLNRFLAHNRGIVFLDVRDIRPDLVCDATAYDVTRPTQPEQQDAWQRALGADGGSASSQLAAQFNLSAPAIREIAQTVQAENASGGLELFEALWQACLAHTRPRLDTLAQRLTPIATWDDIVLPQDRFDLLRQIAGQVRQRGRVYDEWGFRQRMNRGLGIVALFTGESGTGKTMAAEVIANDLNLNLYRIDLSAVVSKYIGETEKNLRRLFDAAEDGGAILFFDEADALFGKRSMVRDSHDRYANIEINYLLQRLEAYRGLAILATNMRAAMDEGFVRRLRFIVNFPMPEAPDRKRMWQQIFPPQTPLAELDMERLAQFPMAGGSIHNAALNAAFLAAEAGTSLTMPLVLTSIRTELLKSDRLINETDFMWGE